MHSMFHTDFFGRKGLGSIGSFGLGQDLSDVQGMVSGIEGLLKDLPPDLLGTYNARYQECMAKVSGGNIADTAVGGKCLYDLYKELKDLMQNGAPPPSVVRAQPAFPVIPVLVGVVGLGALVWGLTKL